LAGERDIVLPRGEGYETLAGFVLARLGFIPQGGESFVFESRRYTVLEVEGRRVSRIRIEMLPQEAAESTAGSLEPGDRRRYSDS
jgi:CBS domain containing-hemolysin-like protein